MPHLRNIKSYFLQKLQMGLQKRVHFIKNISIIYVWSNDHYFVHSMILFIYIFSRHQNLCGLSAIQNHKVKVIAIIFAKRKRRNSGARSELCRIDPDSNSKISSQVPSIYYVSTWREVRGKGGQKWYFVSEIFLTFW